MSGHSLPQRHQSHSGPQNATLKSNPGDSLASTRALVLIQGSERAQRLQGLLASLGIEVWEANCASGAAAVLRRDEARGRSFDFLLVDGHFGGICGMSLSAALCMALGRRPEVILQAPTETVLDSKALSRSGISAVIDPDFTRNELQSLLHSFRTASSDQLPERLTPAGRMTF